MLISDIFVIYVCVYIYIYMQVKCIMLLTKSKAFLKQVYEIARNPLFTVSN